MQAAEAADAVEPDQGEHDGANQEDHRLDEIGVDHGGEAAGDGVDARGNHQDHGGGHRVPADDAFQHHGRRVQVD